MNTKIQKLIYYNEKVLAHFDGRHKLNTSDLLDCFVFSSKILQELVKSGLELTSELNKRELQIVSTAKVKKELLKSLRKKSELEEMTLDSLYNLSVNYNNVNNEANQLRKEVAQLTAELEILKEKEINKF